MIDVEQMPVNATSAVYVMASPDGSACEFLPLSPVAPDSELGELRARWAGRNLRGAGIAFLIHGVPHVVLKEEPSDFLTIVRLTAAFARYCFESLGQGDEVSWLRRLWDLPDERGA